MPTKPPIPAPDAHLRIGPVDIPVFVDPNLKPFGLSWDDPVPGIAVRTFDGVQGMWTLFHEALHMVSTLYHLKWSERDVRTIDASLASLFRDNPWLLEGMLKQLEPTARHDRDAGRGYLERHAQFVNDTPPKD